MRLFSLFILSVSLIFAPAGVAGAGVQSSPPCLRATPACAQWVSLGGGGARAMVYSSQPLDARNASIRRALILVHGTLRNADHYFATAEAAAFLAGALDDTIVIAPAFRSSAKGCGDELLPHEVSWSCEGDSWRSGGFALSDPRLSSFDFMDELLKRLADKSAFPNLARIVVAGHSAGGQFVARYEMSNRIHETLGTSVSYVVANPSSYAWPVPDRPLPTGDAEPAAATAAWGSESVHTGFAYGPLGLAKPSGYNDWPYGLERRATGYTVGVPDERLRRQLVSRPTTYLFSQVDVLPLGGFDDSPRAMAQGPTRRARGEAFVNYINTRLGASAKALIIPECGHNDRCVYTSEAALPVIFPAP